MCDAVNINGRQLEAIQNEGNLKLRQQQSFVQQISSTKTTKSQSMPINQYLNGSLPSTHAIRILQCRRLFNLMQQNISQPKNMLKTSQIQQFVKKLFPSLQLKPINILTLMGEQVNKAKFISILNSELCQVTLTDEQSLRQFYTQAKCLLMSNNPHSRQMFERWDRQENLQPQEVQKIHTMVEQFITRIVPFIEGIELYAFQNTLGQINFCLGVISLPQITQSQVTKVYSTIVNPTILFHVSQFINSLNQFLQKPQLTNQILLQSQNILNYFTLISYLYSSCSIKQMKQKLLKQSCLFYNETFAFLIAALNLPEVRIKKQVSICLSLLSKYVDKFCLWLLSDIDSNLMPLLKTYGTMNDSQGLYYSMISLKYLSKRYQQQPQAYRQSNEKTMQMILLYSFEVLKGSQLMSTQQECLNLINQLIKICHLDYQQLQQMKLTNKVFTSPPNIQSLLVPAALNILETALVYNIPELTQLILNDHGFANCLQSFPEQKASTFYYQLLNILYLLSEKQPSYLIEKNLLNKIINTLTTDSNPTLVSIFTEILLNLINTALDSEPLLETLYNLYGLFDKVIPLLFKKCFTTNPFIEQFFNLQNTVINHNYFDKSMLMILFQSLYYLAVGVNRRHKQLAFSKKLSQQIIQSLSNILRDLFSSQNSDLIELILRQNRLTNSHKLKSPNGTPLYKLINILFEEMTYGMENRPIEFLRIINQQKKNYSLALLQSRLFPIHQLELSNIPIYLNLSLTYQNTTIQRSIPHKFELTSVKSYIKQFIAKLIDSKQIDIKDTILKHIDTLRIIENQVQYRTLVNKSIQNRILDLRFEVTDVKLKTKRNEMSLSYIGLGENQLNRTISGFRDIRQNSFIQRPLSRNTINRAPVSNKFTNLMQQPSRYNEQRKTYSPFNYNYTYRDKSPNFGGSAIHRNL